MTRSHAKSTIGKSELVIIRRFALICDELVISNLLVGISLLLLISAPVFC